MGTSAGRSSKAARGAGAAAARRAAPPTRAARRSLSPAARLQRYLGNQHAQRSPGPPNIHALRTACRECEQEQEEQRSESVQVGGQRRSLDVRGVQTADEARRRPTSVLEELGLGRPLEASVRRRFETVFGKDFSRVRVHHDPEGAALCQRFGALAFTVGNHVAFSAGSYRPGTLLGDALIAHELAHVVQQESPTPLAHTVAADSGSHEALERDADGSAVRAVAALWRKGRRQLGRALQTAAPRLRSGVRLSLTACAGKSAPCKVTGAFSSIPSGNVPATLSGTKLGARFDMIGDFTPAVPECNNCACGEYRQYVKGTFKANGSAVTHALCGTNLSATTFQEDCARIGGTDYKYGYRNNPFPNSRFTNSDQATGCRFEGHDEPGISAGSGTALSVDLEFRGDLVDTCDGNKVLASSTWTVKGTGTVP